ncbi:myb-related transcription factor, partner of profilin-like isoform X2 [Argopecten irradians]|uniref:myb-related transcription factor, partner of profilin-like isoform X2 n=3 Tax=Argopecten irradians TaxID=31199 RepID=UPI0037246853
MADHNSQGGQERKKKTVWTAEEEAALIQAVHSNENVLFGSMSGPGITKLTAKRKETWDNITQVLNSQFQNCRRETKDVKKKYFNTKQRAKAKLDSARHPGTGGGPPPESPSAAEEIILAATGSRPGMMGIPSGIDTDVLPICPERGVCSADSLNEIQAALPSTNGSGNTTFTVSCSDVPSCSDAPNVATCSTTVTVTDEPISGKRLSTSHCDESRSKKQKTTSVLTEKNLLLDNQRLQEEIEKIKEDRKRIKTESEKLEKEKQVLDLKFAYWTLKLQHEFQF